MQISGFAEVSACFHTKGLIKVLILVQTLFFRLVLGKRSATQTKINELETQSYS